MQYGHWHIILISGILSLALVVCHYLSPLLAKLTWLKPNCVTSFASGLVVAYVFLHMLPSLIESRDHIHALLAKTTLMTQSKDLIIFITALIGFEIFYCLERLSIAPGIKKQTALTQNYRIHLSMYFIYNFLITYALLLSIKASIFYSIIYVITVGMHFILTDNHFKRHFAKHFNAFGHLALTGALLLGFVVSIFLYPVQLYISAVLTALLSGAILYNSFTEEITLTRKTSILWFFIGSSIVGLLLALHIGH